LSFHNSSSNIIMNGPASPLEKGVTYAEQAAAADGAGDSDRAYHLYLLCLEWLNLARKYAATPGAAKHIADAMLPRLQRAEELKDSMYGANGAGDGNRISRATATCHEDSDLKNSLGGAVLSERPSTRLSDVAGLDDVKQALREAVLVPMQAPQLLTGRIVPWSGILLYGPPGTGKTHIARAIAGESGCTFFSVSAADLINKYVGQSERLVRSLYDMARASRPAIIFIDEIESIVPARGGGTGGGGEDGGGTVSHMDRVVTEFLKQVDGLGVDNRGVLTLGATNIPWQIDTAALRRFDRRIYVPLPDPAARSKMLSSDLLQVGASAEQIIEMVAATEGYSGSDIKNVLKEGSMRCLRRVLDATHFCPSPTERGAFVPCDEHVPGAMESSYGDWKDKKTLRCPGSTAQDYLEALSVVRPSVKAAGLDRFVAWSTAK